MTNEIEGCANMFFQRLSTEVAFWCLGAHFENMDGSRHVKINAEREALCGVEGRSSGRSNETGHTKLVVEGLRL